MLADWVASRIAPPVPSPDQIPRLPVEWKLMRVEALRARWEREHSQLSLSADNAFPAALLAEIMRLGLPEIGRLIHLDLEAVAGKRTVDLLTSSRTEVGWNGCKDLIRLDCRRWELRLEPEGFHQKTTAVRLRATPTAKIRLEKVPVVTTRSHCSMEMTAVAIRSAVIPVTTVKAPPATSA